MDDSPAHASDGPRLHAQAVLGQGDSLSFFRLKPPLSARVSEISEITAAAPVPREERINFHIGNPLQDERLSSAFLRIALDIEFSQDELRDSEPDAILEHLGWEMPEKPKLAALIRMIQNSTPYMPRGGYARSAPHELIKAFNTWLQTQQESLYYDMGEKSGRREIILASGGIHEALRILLCAISSYLEVTPARLLCYRTEILAPLKTIANIHFEDLDVDEQVAIEKIEQSLADSPGTPAFLLIGDELGEGARRKLRVLSLERPLFFIEANNAPNHLSMAREARLVQRVIRLLTPGIFSPRLHSLSTVFIAGNADFLSVMENIHFSLKGTPSASEVEFLTYILEQNLADLPIDNPSYVRSSQTSFEGLASGAVAETALPQLAERVERYFERLLDDRAQSVARSLSKLEKKTSAVSQQIQKSWKNKVLDEFSTIEANDLLDLLVQNAHSGEWCQALQNSFLSVFVKHQPQYLIDACRVASGSSRTALGILGFHCGISEVVIPDLSWSYEQCFPHVYAVPLTKALELDVEAIIDRVDELCRIDPSWKERGAVVINNPHNATGKVFSQDSVRKLVTYCLQRQIFIIDDLAYQNLAPVDDLPEIKTARQIAEELVQVGVLTGEQAEKAITVHSMSKTDCLAGARLAVVEIRDPLVLQRFEAINSSIEPNIAAIFICYLFYRGSNQAVRSYWRLRNAIFSERTRAILSAVQNLPTDRNPFGLTIHPPTGSMYPLLHVQRLPDGLSLDWMASSLARRGIGLLPLATFSRTEKGFETGRTTFRLTLGGIDRAEILQAKTRRLLIDMNRLIAEEDARYNRRKLPLRSKPFQSSRSNELSYSWDVIGKHIIQQLRDNRYLSYLADLPALDSKQLQKELVQSYAPERLEVFRTRTLERSLINEGLRQRALDDSGSWLAERLEREFMKDYLPRRQELFRARAYDRTVHPTQMYSLSVDLAFNAISEALISRQAIPPTLLEKAVLELMKEFLGQNVSINSQQEADEILLDISMLTASEAYAELFTSTTFAPFLSFWSDWDGSNRPSGQGHRLAAALVVENVRQMNRIFTLLRQAAPDIPVDLELLSELGRLPQQEQRLTRLLNDITQLTQQLEERYRGILPFSIETTSLRRFATRWRLRRDPAQILWQHNDRYEKKMLELRQQRRMMLEKYFALNKKLRKQLHAWIPEILTLRSVDPLLQEVVGYRDILSRVVITPRIPQGLITMRDKFAVDTSVYNIFEINTIAGKYGNPGMVLAIQVSLSTKPEALILLDQKMRTQGEQMYRENPSVEAPSIWLIPLFEDVNSIRSLRSYLDSIWEYASQTHQTSQPAQARFSEIMTEVFIAGSDLSQQISQAAAAHQYLKAKYDLESWLAEHGAAENVRIKLGSGESMQRQGGYYSHAAGLPAFINTEDNRRRFCNHLPAAARKSTSYAVTPLQGVFLGGDLRTFQSNLSEELRYLPVQDSMRLLYHVRESQRIHRNDLIRAAETMVESRLGAHSRGTQELERLTIGASDSLYDGFLDELTGNFRQILYGREEDVVGIHVISYFIGRSLPQLRDRPTSRQILASGAERGQQILANIAEIIPLARQGSLLRAIAHNQAQTVILGINQLTTGLFRALERFSQKVFLPAEQERMIAERILPRLPMYEILNTLRIYQDWRSEFFKQVETAFPAGNSAFAALREDSDAMQRYLPIFQQELLRRHGVSINDFFSQGVFIPELLPTIRPDLAVLLQENLFNSDIDQLLEHASGRISEAWLVEVTRLLQLPAQIHNWRSKIWQVIGDSIYQRVQSFSELATALYAFSSVAVVGPPSSIIRGTRLSPVLAGFLRSARADDEMRQFLVGTIEYLSSYTDGNIEAPVSIIRAMNDVDRLAQIEESALPPEKQDVIRCCLLQIARLAGENG